MTTAEQLDLFTELDATDDEADLVRWEAERDAELARWSIGICQPGHRFALEGDRLAEDNNPADRCAVTAETRRPGGFHGDDEWRARCLGCGWRGPVTDRENIAVEQGHDHAWPGWRDLPTVPRVPDADSPKATEKALAKWTAAVEPQLPDGWLRAGGPILTLRRPPGTRHVPGRTPWGGFDLAVVAPVAVITTPATGGVL